MDKQVGKVMIIDDDNSSSQAIELVCEETKLGFTSFQDPLQAAQEIIKNSQRYEAIVCDYQMPGLTGLEFIEKVNEANISVPIIIITAHGSTEVAINSLESGAYDYVTKPINYKELSIIISRAIKFKKIKEDYSNLQSQIESSQIKSFNFIGKSKKITNIFETIKKVSKTNANVLILGETGTGKELIAQAIHKSSDRKREKLVTINCASIPESLLESELFGHKKGSFTGADTDRDGLFLEANNGTILLDEIGDMPIELQSKLLRVLQEGKVRKVGETKESDINVRIIAATHKNLINLIKNNQFREDLFFRLSVVNISLPSLRERIDDVPLLANHFLKKYRKLHKSTAKTISKDAIESLIGHSWPGNVRELENTIERACIMSAGPTITKNEIILTTSSTTQGYKSESFSELPTLDGLEKDYIAFVMHHCDNIKERAAEILDINRKTLYRKIKDLDL